MNLKRKTITLLAGFSFVFLGIASVNSYSSWVEFQTWNEMIIMNEMGDELIKSTGFNAIERGVSAALLSASEGSNTDALYSKILTLRKKGDAAFSNALKLEDKVKDFARVSPAHPGNLTVLKNSRENFETYRKQVDDYHINKTKPLAVKSWIQTATAYIFAQYNMRNNILSEISVEDLFYVYNEGIKKQVWQASEYAGRERAQIAGLINAKRALNEKDIRTLHSNRAIVELSIDSLLAYPQLKNNPKLLKSLNSMKSNFLGSFETIRSDVYAGLEKGESPINSGEWLSKSTEAINSILAINLAVSEALSASVADAKFEEGAKEIELMVFYFFLLGLSIVSMFYSLKYVVKPIESYAEKLKKVSSSMETRSQSLQSVSDSLAAVVEQQSASTQQSVASIEQISSMVGKTTGFAQSSQGTAKDVSGNVENAKSDIGDLQNKMQELSSLEESLTNIKDAIQKVQEKTQLIDGIVFKTQLLSFNASIEAARAGAHGRGFSIVAEEVGTLALSSGGASKEISDIVFESMDTISDSIAGISRQVETSLDVSRKVLEGFGKLEEGSQQVSSDMEDIYGACEEQLQGIDHTKIALTELTAVSTECSTLASKSLTESQQVNELADTVNETVKGLTKIIEGRKVS